MTRSLFNIDALLPLIEADKIILTPNNRLRNNIRLAYCTHRDNDKSLSRVIPSPKVLSFREWQNTLWLKLQNTGYEKSLCNLASSAVCDQLWQQVIEEAGLETTGVRSLVERRALAQQAREAHNTLLAWCCPTQSQEYDPEINNWISAFENLLKKRNVITEEMSQQILVEAFNDGVLTIENDIYLHSFVDITPLSKTLVEKASLNLHHLKSENTPLQSCIRTAADNQEQEITAAAKWAWQLLQTEKDKSGNKAITVAIIAPQLGRDRDLIERIFCEVFESHYYDPKQLRTALPFNISAAQTLGQTQLIAGALQLLEFNKLQLPVEQVIVLLNSPFYGDVSSETQLRAYIIEQLKKAECFNCSPSEIAQTANTFCQKLHPEDTQAEAPSPEFESSQRWTNNLLQFIAIRRENKKALLPSQWAEIFIQQLQLLAWPGTRRIDSVEFQQVKHWYTLLESFAALDSLEISISLEDALAKLREIAQSTPFQTETRDTPIHIVGAFESVGLQFDYCWVLGLNDKDWPSALRPNPLLPKQLQFSKNMPKASLAREIEIAQTLTDFFLQSAPQCVVSYSRQQGHMQTNASSLIHHLNHQDLNTLIPEQKIGLTSIQNKNSETQWVDCQFGPPLISTAEQPTQGGQTFFKKQAECPFNAFAQFRLNANQVNEPSLGLNAAEKGNAIHSILEGLWRELSDQKTLLALNAMELQNTVLRAVEDYFRTLKKKDVLILGDFYYHLEQQRMCSLIIDWLNVEKQRPAFKVLAVEESLATEFKGIHLNMRIDRIDQLDSGEIILIDYKTSARTSSTWLKERPTEPQLPLYALCYPKKNDGISFAIVEKTKLGFNGVANNGEELQVNGIISTSKLSGVQIESWQQLKTLLEENLTTLAKEIIQGDARVMFPGGQYQQSRDYFSALNRYAEVDFIHYKWNQTS